MFYSLFRQLFNLSPFTIPFFVSFYSSRTSPPSSPTLEFVIPVPSRDSFIVDSFLNFHNFRNRGKSVSLLGRVSETPTTQVPRCTSVHTDLVLLTRLSQCPLFFHYLSISPSTTPGTSGDTLDTEKTPFCVLRFSQNLSPDTRLISYCPSETDDSTLI